MPNSALLEETRTVLRLIGDGVPEPEVRRLVVEDDILAKPTLATRKRIYPLIYHRCLEGHNPPETGPVVTFHGGHVPPPVSDAVLYYHYGISDLLAYELTTKCLCELRDLGALGVTATDLDTWLGHAAKEHPEVLTWSPQTRRRLCRGHLASLKEFGLLEGARRKRFVDYYLPLQAFVYVVYHLRDEGRSAKGIVKSLDFRLFWMAEDRVIALLAEAARAGFLSFRSAGDTFDIRCPKGSLSEYAADLAGEA